MRIERILSFFFILAAINAHSQWSDTLRNIFHGGIFPAASFDSRNSFISDRRAHIWAVKAGVEFDSKIQMGIGYNFLDQHLTKTIPYIDANGVPASTIGILHLGYVSIYGRYVYYKTDHWKFSIMPIQFGFGNSKYIYSDQNGFHKTDKEAIITYEPGISISYKLIYWLGIGADFGYRYMIKKNNAIPENFNSPIYSFYVVIYYGEIYKKLFPGTKLAKMI
ncbi:MAG: hypothetical protein HY064_06975 [Bacteroidetes bacterium]|nr:hypothetical protein [Bacteroidota bacterium]